MEFRAIYAHFTRARYMRTNDDHRVLIIKLMLTTVSRLASKLNQRPSKVYNYLPHSIPRRLERKFLEALLLQAKFIFQYMLDVLLFVEVK